jgi:hypothetical protein
MSAAVGGSIEALNINGRNFPVAADAEGNRKLGGFEVEVEANGDGTARIVKTRVPWALDSIVLEVNDDRADQEFLQEIANGNSFVPISMTLASGITYQARGTIVGEVQMNTQNSTATISLKGPGTLEQQ